MNNFTEEKSRSEIKKEAAHLQKLGERLISLSKEQLLSLEIPTELKEAVLFSKTITTNKAKKRQKQYIGALMRDVDPDPILSTLQKIEDGLPLKNKKTDQSATWAKELIAGNDPLIEDIIENHPETNRQKLRQCVRNARKEKQGEKSQKAFKSLLSYLREITQT